MARTFRNIPDPHYAKKAKSGESGGGGTEIIVPEAQFQSFIIPSYNELKSMIDSGKNIVIHLPSFSEFGIENFYAKINILTASLYEGSGICECKLYPLQAGISFISSGSPDENLTFHYGE